VRDEQEEIRRKLDEVVGTGFDERGKRWGTRWLRASVPRWIAGILIGIAMAALVWWILDSHLTAAHHAPDPKRPVIINIVPTK
jgi:hypothetical protein